MDDEIGRGQRVLWTFLIFTLVVPFFAALLSVAFIVLAPGLQLDWLLPADNPGAGAAGLAVFVWSAIPAAITAVVLLLFVLSKGTFGWIEAAIAGSFAFAIANQLSPAAVHVAPYVLAFLYGLVAVAVRCLLRSGKIIGP